MEKKIMVKYTRIAVTLVSCLSLSILGTAGVASAQARHTVPTVTHVSVSSGHMHSNGDDWCC
jgi:hypothetical protein